MINSKKLIIVVSEDYYLCSHRLPIVYQAIEEGMIVTCATQINKHRETLQLTGAKLVHIPIKRASLNPLRDFSYFLSLYYLYKNEKPDIVHHVAMKPVIYGSIAARLNGIRGVVNALAGLGSTFTCRSIKDRVLGFLIASLFPIVFRAGKRNVAIAQNSSDSVSITKYSRISTSQVALIRGSGVNLIKFPAHPQPQTDPIIVTMVSRMLKPKGVLELVEAAKCLKDKRSDVQIRLVGSPDPENKSSIKHSDLQNWHENNIISWTGPETDISKVWKESHIAVLPTWYGEGIPKALIEAAASSRPAITTDTPGCNDIVQDGLNGILVPPRNIIALVNAIEKLADNPELRQEMGERGRLRVQTEFSDVDVAQKTIGIYKQILDD